MAETLPFPSMGTAKRKVPPVFASDIPVVYEDEGQEEMGDTLSHFISETILHFGITAHLADRRDLLVLPNMNLYYHPTDRKAYVSPDVMVVKPRKRLPKRLRTYTIGKEGPAPLLVVEVLSRRTFQQGDLTTKPDIYARLGVPEYILADVTGDFLPEKLRVQHLIDEEHWTQELDRDGGVTSDLGFRVVIEDDGDLRIVNAKTGQKYLRPKEAEAAEKARIQAQARVRELEAEVARLRKKLPRDSKD